MYKTPLTIVQKIGIWLAVGGYSGMVISAFAFGTDSRAITYGFDCMLVGFVLCIPFKRIFDYLRFLSGKW